MELDLHVRLTNQDLKEFGLDPKNLKVKFQNKEVGPKAVIQQQIANAFIENFKKQMESKNGGQ